MSDSSTQPTEIPVSVPIPEPTQEPAVYLYESALPSNFKQVKSNALSLGFNDSTTTEQIQAIFGSVSGPFHLGIGFRSQSGLIPLLVAKKKPSRGKYISTELLELLTANKANLLSLEFLNMEDFPSDFQANPDLDALGVPMTCTPLNRRKLTNSSFIDAKLKANAQIKAKLHTVKPKSDEVKVAVPLAPKKMRARALFSPRVITGDVGPDIRSGTEIIPGLSYNSITLTFNLSKDTHWGYTLEDDVYIDLLPGETVDGHHHVINVDRDGLGASYGLFGIDGSVASMVNAPLIRDLKVHSQVINTEGGGGGLVFGGQSFFKMDNCTHMGSLDEYCGGMCGESCSDFLIENCKQVGEISAYAGGICGYSCYSGSNGGTINHCESSGAIGDSAGGISGYDCNDLTIYNSKSSGPIGPYAGGIVGDSSNSANGNFTVQSCHSTGIIGYEAGGICGKNCYIDGSGNFNIVDCYSTGVIGYEAGGIIGYNAGDDGEGTFNISNCYSTGTIMDYGGGIVGDSAEYINVTNCWSSGDITNYSGGIIGASSYECVVTSCYSTGKIGPYSGGIVGYDAFSDDTEGYLVDQCYSTGEIGIYGGGIIGYSSGGYDNNGEFYVTNCYTTGDGKSYSGLLIGYDCYEIDVLYCYASGQPANGSLFIGDNSTNILETSCYTRIPTPDELSLTLIKNDVLHNLDITIWKATHHYPILRVFKETPWKPHQYRKNTDTPKLL
jgi:hypothetical protein